MLEDQAKENAARAKDETEIKQAEGNLRKAELEMQNVETVSRIDEAQENLDEAKATLQQLRETFDLKRKAAQAATGYAAGESIAQPVRALKGFQQVSLAAGDEKSNVCPGGGCFRAVE